MRHSFNKRAKEYLKNCDIQNDIARILLLFFDYKNIRTVLDLGAGSGNIAKNLDFNLDYLLAIDNSPTMLALHPTKLSNIKNIELRECNFENFIFNQKFDLLISSSALHWATNLEVILKNIKDSNNFKYLAFSFFTNKSLNNLHNFLGTKSPLLSSYDLETILSKYFIFQSKIMSFKKVFKNRDEYFLYLRGCGLLGGGNLSFYDKKRLKFEYPFLEADFEVLFVKIKMI
ncbi:methyltransferase domain-containing protein [Helicobacter sp. MIT 14-3879]|uniref:methyltransferase domain-containing protein n=1 Tax=Helicobacter sp. MIT 14-3879 TaxID=2040649 RepID=UPI000E1EB627|nr:methyltransferase domain-containing protein [Helicobacter sp. MIT 14-3879]RDU64166.1 hypothetical protein CQA44_04375 [Helicobacter sp. MIT 14-3879]